MMIRLMICLPLLALAACDKPSVTAEASADAKIAAGKVALVAVAPDGTRLWAVSPPGGKSRVYFAATGTSAAHSEVCGKNCTRTVADIVPTAPDIEPDMPVWNGR